MKKFFGIELDWNCPDERFQSITARLLLSPNIYAKNALHILNMLKKGALTYDDIVKKTNAQIEKLKNEIEFKKDFKQKFDNWTSHFGNLTGEDKIYLKNEFGISIDELTNSFSPRSPRDIANYIKRTVKGQDAAIDELAVSFYLHYFCKTNNFQSDIKPSVLLLGPTGSGKSEILRVYGQICQCPIIRINTCEISPEGWSGLHLSDILSNEYVSGTSIEDLKYSVLIFNEFDKITHHNANTEKNNSIASDIDMQRNLMRIFEKGYEIPLHGTGINQTDIIGKVQVDNMLVCFDGAFAGIESIIARRINIKKIGFKNSTTIPKDNLMKYVNNDDLTEWGYLPELLGRIGSRVVMNKLQPAQIQEILTCAEGNILEQHKIFCAKNNIDLEFEHDALEYISEEIYKSGVGFRAAKNLISKIMFNIYYNISIETQRTKLSVTKDYVIENLKNNNL